MRRTVSLPLEGLLSLGAGMRLMAVGLIVLLAAACVPALPVLTAMACVTLGATVVAHFRFRNTPHKDVIMAVQSATYASLYALFVGARLHSDAAGLGLLHSLDLLASGPVLVIAVRWVTVTLGRS